MSQAARQGDVISYLEMCRQEGASLQRGMNFRLRQGTSVILMSLRSGAPYADQIEDDGRTIIYEGHDVPGGKSGGDPKTVDQVAFSHSGNPTQNGLFFEAAMKYKRGESEAEHVTVYEKIKQGIWVFNGLFRLVDAWQEVCDGRKVFKFRLKSEDKALVSAPGKIAIEHTRLIPSAVKLQVWRRDGGKCVLCGSKKNLHFDHVIPFSKGGTSLLAENIQILCAKHNLAKKDEIR